MVGPSACRSVLIGELKHNSDKLQAQVTCYVTHSFISAGEEQQGGFAGPTARRNVFMGELKQMGIKAPDQIATPSVRNDSAFLFTVVGESVCAGQGS